jgi:hypothetical protein
MAEFGGSSEYALGQDNSCVTATLNQPLQKAPEKSRVARPVSKTELYITNLLPFRVMPQAVSFLPLRERVMPDIPLFDDDESPRECPIFIRYADHMVSFADLRRFPDFSLKRGFLEKVEIRPVEQVLQSPNHHLFVWLVNKHLEFFLQKFPLVVESRRKRAFFRLIGEGCTTIKYNSRLRKGISRDVVKKRGEEPRCFYENEAILYNVVAYLGQWAVQVRPSYVFTRADGITPLPQLAQTRRATRRFKFDQNPNVDDDLTFWARYLSKGEPTVSLGNVGVSDLILDSEYCSAEVPTLAER